MTVPIHPRTVILFRTI